MVLDSFDPSKADTLINLPALATKITLPGLSDDPESMMCFTDNDGSNKCFLYNGASKVECNGDECFVSYNTLNQRLLGNGNRLKKLGLDVLMIPDGLSTSVILVGKMPRNKLRTLKKIVGKNIEEEETESLPSFKNGFPNPPKKCNLNPLAKVCSPYLSSDDWMYIPVIGFKRKVDVMKNPKTILKSEILPELKKAKDTLVKLIKGKKKEKDGSVVHH